MAYQQQPESTTVTENMQNHESSPIKTEMELDEPISYDDLENGWEALRATKIEDANDIDGCDPCKLSWEEPNDVILKRPTSLVLKEVGCMKVESSKEEMRESTVERDVDFQNWKLCTPEYEQVNENVRCIPHDNGVKTEPRQHSYKKHGVIMRSAHNINLDDVVMPEINEHVDSLWQRLVDGKDGHGQHDSDDNTNIKHEMMEIIKEEPEYVTNGKTDCLQDNNDLRPQPEHGLIQRAIVKCEKPDMSYDSVECSHTHLEGRAPKNEPSDVINEETECSQDNSDLRESPENGLIRRAIVNSEIPFNDTGENASGMVGTVPEVIDPARYLLQTLLETEVDIDQRGSKTLLISEKDDRTKESGKKKKTYIPFKCTECEYETHDKRYAETHKMAHTGEKPFACKFCDFRSNRMYVLKCHSAVHTTERPFACEVCDFRCKLRGALQNHMKTHSTEKNFSCNKCDYITNQWTSLVKHSGVHSSERPYKCYHCDYSSSNKGQIYVHIRKRHLGGVPKPFACHLCPVKCVTKHIFQIHMRIHTGERPYQCKHCEYKCQQSGTLYRHEKTHSESKEYTCNVCDASFVMDKYLKRHMKVHTEERPFQCDNCDYKAKSKEALKSHKKIHSYTEERPYACDQCEYKARDPSVLKTHKKNHSRLRSYQCELCDYKCKNSDNLRSHVMTHTGEKPYACDECDYTCARPYVLKCHKMTHTDEKPYACHLCLYRCRQKSQLPIHVRNVHTNERPYACEVCDSKFKDKASLKYHMSRHNGYKPYVCDICNYKCSRKFLLKVHKRRHTGEKPYKCDSCDYAAVVPFELNSHMVEVHSGKPYACAICDFKCTTHKVLTEHKKTHVAKIE